MKIMAFGDIHFHHTHRYSHITPEGFSIRELEHLQCANVLIDLYKKENIDKVVFLGDMWGPVGDTMSCQTLTAITEFLSRLVEVFPLDIIIGNHDIAGQVNNQYSHKLYPFIGWKDIKIYDNPMIVDNFVYMPYCLCDEFATSFLENIKDKENKIVFSHLELAGINLGNNIFTTKGVDLALLKKFKMVLQGHYHNGGNYAKNIKIAGSTQRLSFKDQGISRNNILIYDTDTNIVYRKSFNCPDWLTFTDDNINDILSIDNNNYVKINITSDLLLTKEIKEKLDMVKGKDVHIELSRIKVDKNIVENTESVSELDVIKKFVDNSDNDTNIKEDLIQEGIRLLNKVQTS